MSKKRKVGEMLLEAGLIDEFQLKTALNQQKQWGRPLGVTLVEMGFVCEPEVTRVLSEQLHLRIIDLDAKIVAPEVVELVPQEIASKEHCMPLAVQGEGSTKDLYVGMSDPTNLGAVDDIGFRTGYKICPVLVGDQQLETLIDRSYRVGNIHNRWTQITPEDIRGPGTGTREPRCEADAQPLEPREQPPVAPADEPELVLTAPADEPEPLLTTSADEPQDSFMNRMQTLTDAISARNPESQGCALQALIQLLISRGMIDSDELLRAIETIAAARK